MDTSKATARPWQLEEREQGREYRIVANGGGTVAILRNYGPSADNMPATYFLNTLRENARLIVEAVNSYDAMMEAMLRIKAWIPEMRPQDGELADAAIAEIESILALAGGEGREA